MAALSKVKVVQIDASRDHSVFLDSKLANPHCTLQQSCRAFSVAVKCFVLCLINQPAGTICTDECSIQNCSLFTFCRGNSYTCGFNEAHQLGHGTNPTTAPHSLLCPVPVCLR